MAWTVQVPSRPVAQVVIGTIVRHMHQPPPPQLECALQTLQSTDAIACRHGFMEERTSIAASTLQTMSYH
eukprot:6424236-Amphidinium_carterae.1